jgi:hypothetical protein
MEQLIPKIEETDGSLPEYLEMYQISGQGEITPHSFLRYLKDKEQDIAIQKQLENNTDRPRRDLKSVSVKVETSTAEEDSDLEVQKAVHNVIVFASKEEIVSLIKQYFNNSDIRVQKAAVGGIMFAPEEERASLIRQCFNNPNSEVQKAAAEVIIFAPKKQIAPLIREYLENPNPVVQEAAARVIPFAPEEERASLIKQCLSNPDLEMQRYTIEIIGFIPRENREELFNLITEKNLREEFIKSRLYRDRDINNEVFSRQNFQKTGSKTTLVGGELKDKTIIRSIGPEAFLIWQRLYEDYKLWQDAGFDYVPIEPIQSYRLNNEGLVDVYSGILDLDFDDNRLTMIPNSESMTQQLRGQKTRIIQVLDNLKIEHGHTHDGNFCLRFFRDKNGQPDFERTPRLYLIDFDQAASPEK